MTNMVRKIRQKENRVLCWGEKKKGTAVKHSILTGQIQRTERVWGTIFLTFPSKEHEGDQPVHNLNKSTHVNHQLKI